MKKQLFPAISFHLLVAASEGPLLIIHGGFDSIGEELYF